jgi:hypothetical protein
MHYHPLLLTHTSLLLHCNIICSTHLEISPSHSVLIGDAQGIVHQSFWLVGCVDFYRTLRLLLCMSVFLPSSRMMLFECYFDTPTFDDENDAV